MEKRGGRKVGLLFSNPAFRCPGAGLSSFHRLHSARRKVVLDAIVSPVQGQMAILLWYCLTSKLALREFKVDYHLFPHSLDSDRWLYGATRQIYIYGAYPNSLRPPQDGPIPDAAE